MPKKNTSIGKYKRQKLLGKGQFGEVYQAYDRALQAHRALKIIEAPDPKKLVEKLHEARLLEICKHKHVVEVKDADIEIVDGRRAVVIVTELLKGGSAQDLLRNGFLPLSASIRIICDALFGLEHLHLNGVLHCDIKPANILLTKNIKAKLSDFGLAVRFQMGEMPPFVYTLHMAPENTTGTQGSILSDVYAMGVTLYRLVNNIVDFSGTAPNNLESQIRRGKFPDRQKYRSYIPTKIKRITNKAMNVNETSRYPSAQKFRQALEKIEINIDWRRISSMEWEGQQAQRMCTLVAIPKRSGWCVEFLKNGRRQSNLCRSGIADNHQAESLICRIIAETTIH
jgi:serine/threonine protein kinase